MPFKIIQKKFKSFDGTTIGYQTMGTGKKIIILCNGLGGTAVTWKPLYEHFGKRYKFICWDYRGLFRSDPPADETRMTIEDHARDLDYLVKTEGITEAVIGGWSMGVQVNLEYYRLNPKIYKGMFLLNGTAGYPFDSALNNPLSKYILPTINELAHKIVPALQPTFKPLAARALDSKAFLKLIAKLGLIHENIQSDVFKEVAKEMVLTDLSMYHVIMRHLSTHDASDVLPLVKTPLLIMAGTADLMTPLKVSEKMAASSDHAELLIIPEGTHYSILEFPETINLRMEHFLKENYPI